MAGRSPSPGAVTTPTSAPVPMTRQTTQECLTWAQTATPGSPRSPDERLTPHIGSASHDVLIPTSNALPSGAPSTTAGGSAKTSTRLQPPPSSTDHTPDSSRHFGKLRPPSIRLPPDSHAVAEQQQQQQQQQARRDQANPPSAKRRSTSVQLQQEQQQPKGRGEMSSSRNLPPRRASSLPPPAPHLHGLPDADPAASIADAAAAASHMDSRMWPWQRKVDSRENVMQDDDNADLDEVINRPGLRVSALFVITFVVSSLMLGLFWVLISVAFRDVRVRTESIGNSNHISTAALHWSSIVSEVQQRMNLTMNLFVSGSAATELMPFMCSVGAFRISSLVSIPISVGDTDIIPILCADTRQKGSHVIVNETGIVNPNSTAWQQGSLRVAAAFTAWSRINQTHDNIAAAFDVNMYATCSEECIPDNGNATRPKRLTTISQRLIWDQMGLRRDLERIYPLLSFTHNLSSAEITASIKAAEVLDPGLFNVRVLFSAGGADDDSSITFTVLQGLTMQLITMRKSDAFGILYGFDGARTPDVDAVAQPFRFSQTVVLVEDNVPSMRLNNFRDAIKTISREAGIDERPYIGPLRTMFASAVANIDATADRDLQENFRRQCAGASLSSEYSVILDYPFRITGIDGEGSYPIRRFLPNAKRITPGIGFSVGSLRGDVDSGVTMCAQICQVVSKYAIEKYHRENTLRQVPFSYDFSSTGQPEYYNGNETTTLSTLSSAMPAPTENKTLPDPSEERTVPEACPADAGQRIFVMATVTDSNEQADAVSVTITAVGWFSVAGNFVMHVILYGVVAVPIRYLRTRVLCTLQGRPMKFAIARHLVIRVTRAMWVGEIRSLNNAYAAMVLKYEQNKRFIPNYVRRRQQQTNLRVLMAEAERMESEQLAFGTNVQPSVEELAAQRRRARTQRARQSESNVADEDLLAAATAFGGPHADANAAAISASTRIDGMGVSTTNLAEVGATSLGLGEPAVGVQPGSPQHNRMSISDSMHPGASLESHSIIPGKPSFDDALPVHRPAIPAPRLTESQKRTQRLHLAEPPSPLVAGNTAFVPQRGHVTRTASMTLVDKASVLVISLSFLENAYMDNFLAAETVHQKVIATVLDCVRRHGGEPFGREALVIGASWNAFEPEAFHVQAAIACALDLVRTFSTLRNCGVKMGFAVNTGPVVCGVVGDAVTVSHTLLGKTVSLAVQLAELGKDLKGVTMLVTQAVRQAVSIFHEFLLVDVVLSEEDQKKGGAPMNLFDVRPGTSKSLHPDSHQAPLTSTQLERNTFSVAYNTAFTQFRQHDFKGTLNTLSSLIIREEESAASSDAPAQSNRRNDAALVRLLHLAHYYNKHPHELPNPYVRHVPAWKLYELPAEADESLAASGFFITSEGDFSGHHTMRSNDDGAAFDRVPTSAMTIASPNHRPPGLTPQSTSGSRIFGNPMETSFRTQLAQAINKRGHKRTDSGLSTKTAQTATGLARPAASNLDASPTVEPTSASRSEDPGTSQVPSGSLTFDKAAAAQTVAEQVALERASSGEHGGPPNQSSLVPVLRVTSSRSTSERDFRDAPELENTGATPRTKTNSSPTRNGSKKDSEENPEDNGDGDVDDGEGSGDSVKRTAASPKKATDSSTSRARAAGVPPRAPSAHWDPLGETIEFANASFRGQVPQQFVESLLHWKPKNRKTSPFPPRRDVPRDDSTARYGGDQTMLGMMSPVIIANEDHSPVGIPSTGMMPCAVMGPPECPATATGSMHNSHEEPSNPVGTTLRRSARDGKLRSQRRQPRGVHVDHRVLADRRSPAEAIGGGRRSRREGQAALRQHRPRRFCGN
jgi:hypothetical protein